MAILQLTYPNMSSYCSFAPTVTKNEFRRVKNFGASGVQLQMRPPKAHQEGR